MALIKLFTPGSNTPDMPGPPPGAPDYSVYRDTDEGVDFFKLNGTISTTGGDVEKDNPRDLPDFVGTVSAFTVDGESLGFSVEDVSLDAGSFMGSIDAAWWSALLAGDDTVIGTLGDDTLDGGAGDDQLFGRAGWDNLYGGGGDDALFGGKGRDYLHGWRGDNGLFGGAGRDTFFIDAGRNYIETGGGADDVILDFSRAKGTVADFTVGTDKIVLATGEESPPSVDDLIDDGTLKITGDKFHTVIHFGDAKLTLLDVARSDFDPDAIIIG